MPMIYSVVSVLFLAWAISASMAPAIVYSATIYNAQDSAISCYIVWSKPSASDENSVLFTVGKGKSYNVDEKQVDQGDWVARAAIKEVHCGHLVLTAPFDGVESPSVNWQFRIEANRIVSLVPDSHSTEH